MNRAKLKALVHYIIAKSDPSRLGAIRLNKILWYMDSLAYRLDGASVTGETYVKQKFGPVSEHVLAMLGELEHENAIVIRTADRRFGRNITEYIARGDPDITVLSAQELALVEQFRATICDKFSAMEISELSHDDVWAAANIGERIPFSATLVSAPGEITDDVYKWADSVVARYEAAGPRAV